MAEGAELHADGAADLKTAIWLALCPAGHKAPEERRMQGGTTLRRRSTPAGQRPLAASVNAHIGEILKCIIVVIITAIGNTDGFGGKSVGN